MRRVWTETDKRWARETDSRIVKTMTIVFGLVASANAARFLQTSQSWQIISAVAFGANSMVWGFVWRHQSRLGVARKKDSAA